MRHLSITLSNVSQALNRLDRHVYVDVYIPHGTYCKFLLDYQNHLCFKSLFNAYKTLDEVVVVVINNIEEHGVSKNRQNDNHFIKWLNDFEFQR